MSEKTTVITCKPSRWFIWRAVLMSAMFLGFGAFFCYDGAVGYKNYNAQYYEYMGYLQAKKSFEENQRLAETSGKPTVTSQAESWKAFASTQTTKIYMGHDLKEEVTDLEGCFAEGFQVPQKWPSIFAENYDEMNKNGGAYLLWKQYTSEKGLEIGAEEHFKTLSTIKGQFNWAIGSFILGGIALFFLVRTLGRSMVVDSESYVAPNGTRIAFSAIHKIDKRKWKGKGLAFLYYNDDSDKEVKARVDGMVYGQFDKENPHNAEALFTRIEQSVTAEIIDYEDTEGEQDESDSGGDEPPEDTTASV